MNYSLRIYKPRRSNDGCASKFELTTKKHRNKNIDVPTVFLDVAGQTGIDANGNASFDWENGKLTFKMGMADVTDMLCVIRGLKPCVGAIPKAGERAKGLFHKSGNGNSSLQFGINDEGTAYALRLSVQRDGNVTALNHMVTLAEAESIRILLEQAVLQMMEQRQYNNPE